ncbi:helix-turn-helix domain-containing protein [Streptomyces scopuliridis]|nr:helix-turn-helix domain-containing protein [Streptomyces scopuliridis]
MAFAQLREQARRPAICDRSSRHTRGCCTRARWEPRLTDELLRQLRKRTRLTQEQLAERSTVSVRAIRRLETGRSTDHRLKTLNLLADALGAGPEERRQLTGTLDRAQPGPAPGRMKRQPHGPRPWPPCPPCRPLRPPPRLPTPPPCWPLKSGVVGNARTASPSCPRHPRRDLRPLPRPGPPPRTGRRPLPGDPPHPRTGLRRLRPHLSPRCWPAPCPT